MRILRPFSISSKKKIALVLSGGGIKAAAFHIGVCLALKEKGFRFAGGTKSQVNRNFSGSSSENKVIRSYVGSSAGAFVTSILAAGYSIESLVNAFDIGIGQKPHYTDHTFGELRPLRYKDIFSINSKGIINSVPSFFGQKAIAKGGGIEALFKNRFKVNGFFTTRNLERYLSKYAFSHNEFEQLGVELFIIGTELNNSKKVIFGPFHSEESNSETLKFIGDAKISDAVAASTSLPPVFSPYKIKINGQPESYFFDGEIRDTLSTHVAADFGADLVISSYSVEPYHLNNKVGSLHNYGIPVIINQALYQVIQQKIDRHIRHLINLQTLYGELENYLIDQKVSTEIKNHILSIIQKNLNYKPNVDYINIHPRPENDEMFFADHFSLNPKVLEQVVKIGFKSALHALRKYSD